MSNHYLEYIDLLSIWEVAHRWVELHPDQTDPENLPDVLTEQIREILVFFDRFHTIYDETGDPDYDRSLSANGDFTKNHEPHHLAHQLIMKRQYPKDDLDSLYICRSDVRQWCRYTWSPLPQFWFSDDEIDTHNKALGMDEPSLVTASKNLRKDQKTKNKCQILAKQLWIDSPQINISNMANHTQIIEICTIETKTFNDETRRRWVREVSPDYLKGKSGRPKKLT